MFSVLVSVILATLVTAAPSVITIGDSTVTDGAGWGKGFCDATTGLASCVNLSVGGTTTVSWQRKAEFSMMLTKCKTANTFATIQFGHNDQKVMDTAMFASNLEGVTKTIKNAGCSPILVTSLCRRTFSGGTLTDILAPYSDQTISIAKKLDLPVLPLLADCREYVQKLGKANAVQFNLDFTTTNTDTTHLNEMGSQYFGRMVADELKALVPALAENIKDDPELSAKIAAGTL